MLKVLTAALIFMSLACAQSITVTASQSVYLQPDEVSLSVEAVGRSFADVVAGLKQLGITAANLSGVRTGNSHGLATQLVWSFTWGVPIAKLQETIAALKSMHLRPGDRTAALVVNFSVTSSDVSAVSLNAQACSWSNLLKDARAQASGLAAAANLRLGNILSLSDGTPLVTNPFAAGYASFLLGVVSTTFIPPVTTPICSLTVAFGAS